MDCLSGRIGLRGDGSIVTDPPTPPIVQLYINDLPGITLANIEALATDEDEEGFAEVWRKVKQSADRKFDLFLRAELNKCCQLTGAACECVVCHEDNIALFDVALWYLYGCELMIFRTSTDAMNRYTTIDLDKAEKLKQDFFLEFQASLTDAVKAVNIADSDCLTDDCVGSSDSSQWVYNLP